MSEIGKIVRGLLKARMEVARITMPEDGSPVGIRQLSDAEIAECNVAAYAVVAKQCAVRGVDVARFIEANPDGFNRAQIHQVLVRALRDPDDHSKPMFEGEKGQASIDALVSLDASYINALYNAYLDHQDRKAPATVVDDEAIPAAVAAMVDDAELEYALAQMDAATLVRMMRYTLRLARSAKTTED